MWGSDVSTQRFSFVLENGVEGEKQGFLLLKDKSKLVFLRHKALETFSFTECHY